MAALVSVTEQTAALAEETGAAGEERTALEAGICLAVVAETETPSEAAPEVPEGTTARARVPAVAAARPAWGLAVEVLEAVADVAGVVEGADRQQKREQSRGSAI